MTLASAKVVNHIDRTSVPAGSKNTRPLTYEYAIGNQSDLPDPQFEFNAFSSDFRPSDNNGPAARSQLGSVIHSSITENAKREGVIVARDETASKLMKSDGVSMHVFYRSERSMIYTIITGTVAGLSLGLLPAYAKKTIYIETEIVHKNQVVAESKYEADVSAWEMPIYNPLVWIGKMFFGNWEQASTQATQDMVQAAIADYAQLQMTADAPEGQKISAVKAASYRIHEIREKNIILKITPASTPIFPGKVVDFMNAFGGKTGEGVVSEVYHSKAIVRHRSGFVDKSCVAAAR